MTTESAAAPIASTSRSYRYYVLGLLTFVYMLNFIDRQILAILMPVIKVELQLTDTQLGFLSGLAFAVFYSMLGIPIARLADRRDRRMIVAVSIALWSVMTAACGLAGSFAALVTARVFVAIGEAGGTPPSHSILSDYFPLSERATAMAIYATGVSLGVVFGLAFGGWLGQTYGWRYAFIILGLPGLLVAAVVAFSLREPQRTFAPAAQADGFSGFLRHIGRFRSVPHFVAAAALQTLVSYAFTQWSASFLVRSFGYSLVEAGGALALVIGVGGGIGTVLGGMLVDRAARTDQRWYMWMPAILALVYDATIIPAYLAGSGALTVMLLIPPAFFSLAYIGPVQALTQTLAGARMRATASASFLLVINLIGLGLGPQIVGILSDALAPAQGVHSLRYALLIVSVLGATWAAIHYVLAARNIREDLALSRELEMRSGGDGATAAQGASPKPAGAGQ